MNIWLIVNTLVVIYISVGATLGLVVYISPNPEGFEEQIEEWAEMGNMTPSGFYTAACVIIAVLWPWIIHKVLTDNKAQK